MTESGAGSWRIGSKVVGRIGFGAMRLTGRVPFGEGSPGDLDQGVRVLRRAAELGVNHFDTASFYRSSLHGANELLKTALWPYSDDILIGIKVRPICNEKDSRSQTKLRRIFENSIASRSTLSICAREQVSRLPTISRPFQI